VLYLNVLGSEDLGALDCLLVLLLLGLLFELGEVPDANGLVEGRTGNERVVRVERSAHNVVAVACQDCHHASVLPVPESHRLVVTAGQNPRQLGVEFYGSHVV